MTATPVDIASDESRMKRGNLLPSSFINDPEHWRQRAAELRALAEQVSDLRSKQIMLGIANEYDRLAERAEKRAKGLPQSK